ncbi:MAG: extracellular solute-binding protein [Oscillospiraceae bacterium]|nr:extracellular solute-binding protein [Oscillospiraceae bacterium]
MKKIVSVVLLVGCMALLLAGCGGGGTGSGNNGDRVVIYTAAEDERIAYIQQELDKKFPNVEIVIQSLGTGQLLSKLQAEGKNSDCDIFYDLEVVNAEIILNENPDLFVDLTDYDFSVYDASVTGYTDRHHRYAVNGKTAGAFLVNSRVLEEKGLSVPASYEDMLKPEYAGLISMPSPKSSGTGYSYYNGMITLLGREDGMQYFESLNPNIKEYTTSGSAPAKAAVRGDVGIAYGLLWQCVNYANENEGMKVVIPDQGLAFDLFTMGMLSGHETKGSVKAVFDFLYNDLNKPQCARFNPDKIYVDMPAAGIANYPVGYDEITMNGLFDFQYKQGLLDEWKY